MTHTTLTTPEAVRAALERGEPVEIRSRVQPSSWWPLGESWTVDRIAEYIDAGYQFRAPLPAAAVPAAGDWVAENARLREALTWALPMLNTPTPASRAACPEYCEKYDIARAMLAATPAPPEKSGADRDWCTPGLIEALKVRKQIDEDGTLIGVSHQALDEATKILEAIAAEPAPLSEQGKADRDLFLLGTSFMVGGKRIDPARVTIERKAETREAVAIYQTMCTDEDDLPNGPRDLWMDVPKESFNELVKRDDIRGRIVYTTPPATPELLARLSALKRYHVDDDGYHHEEPGGEWIDWHELRALIAGAQK